MFKNVVNTVAVVGVTSILTIIGIYFYRKKKSDQIPTEWKSVGKVTNLYLYPLKSGRAIELKEAECTKFGISHTYEDSKALQLRDRSFIVYKESDNEFRTARTYPAMVLIEISVHDEFYIVIEAPGMRQLYVKLPLFDLGGMKDIKMRNEIIKANDCGDEAANWFSRYLLDSPNGLRLAYNLAEVPRNLTGAYPKHAELFPKLDNESGGLFSDLSAYMLMSKSSIAELNSRFDVEDEVNARYFRPNILVEGEDLLPFHEDDWDWVKVGNVVFRNVKPCTRCIFTTINPDTGVLHPQQEPLKTLKKYRIWNHVDKNSPIMGINMSLKSKGNIYVGDNVSIGLK